MSDNLPKVHARAAIVANKNLVQLDIDQMWRFAQAYAQAAVFTGKGYNNASAQELLVRISAGQAIGLDPFTAVSELRFIENRLEMSTNLQLALAKANGRYDYRVEWGDSLQDVGVTAEMLAAASVTPQEAAGWPTPRWCRMTVFEIIDGKREHVGDSLWTLLDSHIAGLLRPTKSGKPSNHLKYPRAMLFNRAGSAAVGYYMPDATIVRSYGPGEIEGWSEETRELAAQREAEAVEEEVEDAEVVVEEPEPKAGRFDGVDAPNAPVSPTSGRVQDEPAAPEPMTPQHDEVTGEMREDETVNEAMERMEREEALPADALPGAPEPEIEAPTVEVSPHAPTINTQRQKLLFALCRRANLTDQRRYEITTEVTGQRHMDKILESQFQAMIDRLNAEVAIKEDPGSEE